MRETATFWRAPEFDDMELLRATFISHAYARHTHPGYAIGMIEQGAEVFYYRGATHCALAGDVVVINPDEVHTGHSGDASGWSYRMFYPDVALMRRLSADMGGTGNAPYFTAAVIKDPDLAGQIQRLHHLLEYSKASLARETCFCEIMSRLILRHAANAPALPRRGIEHHTVARAAAFLEAHLSANITLEELSLQVGVSPFYLSRLFRRCTGLPPHAYLKQRRIVKAKAMLRRGVPIVQVAVATGFADQSHLTRHFKQIVGVTPGRYAR
jgi:AraC-like DNA-binding protein